MEDKVAQLGDYIIFWEGKISGGALLAIINIKEGINSGMLKGIETKYLGVGY